MTKYDLRGLDAGRVAIAVAFVVLAALILIAGALPEGWDLLVLPTVPAAPLLGVAAYRSIRQNGGDQ